MKKQISLILLIQSLCLSQIAQQISCGEFHSFLLCDNGDLYTFGHNAAGQLGTGNYDYQTLPYHLESLPPISQAAGGGYHSLAVTDDGHVYSWGSSEYGQVGDGSQGTFYNTPQLISGIEDVIQVDAGRYFSAALKSDGTVWTWGRNDSGNLGHGNYDAATVPTQVMELTDIVSIECGSWSLFAIDSDGTVYCFGDNNFSALGLGSDFPTTYNTPQTMNITDVIKIEAGYWHAIALKSDGTVWAWGTDAFGQLGQGQSGFGNIPIQVSSLTNIVDIAAGNGFCLAMDSEGTLFTWGDNIYGQLGNGTTGSFSNVPTILNGVSEVVEIACGDHHLLCLAENGELLGCGKNDGGQLGIGSNEDSNELVLSTNSCGLIDHTQNLSYAELSLYPNPAAEEVFIGAFSGYYDLCVYDVTGKKVISGNFFGNQVIDVSRLNQGVYIFRIIMDEITREQKMIIR